LDVTQLVRYRRFGTANRSHLPDQWRGDRGGKNSDLVMASDYGG